MLLKEAMMVFICLSLGYAVCVLAEKQKKLMRTIGFTIGISIITLTLLYGLVSSDLASSRCMGMKNRPFMAHRGMPSK
ncbi:MAG: hypothetical protein WC779_06555 [Candidatus Omnitrophota bacterium]|jgi:hypothetical protein